MLYSMNPPATVSNDITLKKLRSLVKKENKNEQEIKLCNEFQRLSWTFKLTLFFLSVLRIGVNSFLGELKPWWKLCLIGFLFNIVIFAVAYIFMYRDINSYFLKETGYKLLGITNWNFIVELLVKFLFTKFCISYFLISLVNFSILDCSFTTQSALMLAAAVS
jgi:hypothetical protein